MTGGLFDPLGMEPPRPGRDGRRARLAAWLASALLAALAILLAVAWLRDDGGRGHPVAVAPIVPVEAPPKPPVPAAGPVPAPPPTAPAPAPAPPPGAPTIRDDQEVEIQNGVRIVRPRRTAPAAAAGGRTVPVDPPGTAR